MKSATTNPMTSKMVQRLLAPATSRKARPAASEKSVVLSAVRAAAAAAPEGDLLSVAAVRATCSLDKATFDKAALELQAEGAIVLHHHDAWQWLSAERQAAMVASGEYRFSGVALRRG